MSSPALEAFLAALYTDTALLERFLQDPEAAARSAGLSSDEVNALGAIDRAGLQMAARSYANKRANHRRRRGRLTQFLFGVWRIIRPKRH